MGFCLNFMLSWGKRNKISSCFANHNKSTILGLIYYYQKIKKKSFNPDPSGSKNITIHYPGAIFGTFIINQFTWSLFWQFWYLIVHWFKFKKLAILLPGAFLGTFEKIRKNFFFTKNHSVYRKSKSKIFPEFLVDDFNPKKIKQIREDKNGSRWQD